MREILILQIRSTILVMAKNNIKNSSPHNPPKVEGLSDEYIQNVKVAMEKIYTHVE